MKNLIFTLALVFALASLHSFAGSIFGSVKDENGNPVAGAEVKVYGKDIKTKTNEKGLFKIENELLVDGNRYSVRVEADGFDSGQTLSTTRSSASPKKSKKLKKKSRKKPRRQQNPRKKNKEASPILHLLRPILHLLRLFY